MDQITVNVNTTPGGHLKGVGGNQPWRLEMRLEIKITDNKKGLTKSCKPLKLLWYARLDSNQRLSAPEADALSPELRAHNGIFERKIK